MRQEYRWEFVKDGQGYLYRDLDHCFREAVLESRKNPNHTIKIEIFRPKREVIGFLKDGEFLTPDQMSAIIEKER